MLYPHPFAFRITLAASLCAALVLQGCASSPSTSSDAAQDDSRPAASANKADSREDGPANDKLRKRAAQTLGVSASTVHISAVDKEGGMSGRINFRATRGRSGYMCYVTSSMGVMSDAICTRAQGASASEMAARPARDSKPGKNKAEADKPAEKDDSNNDRLRKRAAQTFGVQPSAVRISEVEKEGSLSGRINFRATIGRSSYGCYVTSSFGVMSDAICTRPNGGGIVGSENNALLRAADGLNRRR